MKKILIGSLLVLALIEATSIASAKTTQNNNPKNHTGSMMGFLGKIHAPGKMMHSNVYNTQEINGTVLSVGQGTLTIKARNTQYVITVPSGAIISNRIWDPISFSDIKVGDKIKIYGTDTSGTITAKLIKDLSIPQITEKTITGNVNSINGGILIITAGNTQYTVNTASTTIISDRIWNKINLTDIKVNDKVNIFGTVTGTNTISAKLVRDLSLPQVVALSTPTPTATPSPTP